MTRGDVSVLVLSEFYSVKSCFQQPLAILFYFVHTYTELRSCLQRINSVFLSITV